MTARRDSRPRKEPTDRRTTQKTSRGNPGSTSNPGASVKADRSVPADRQANGRTTSPELGAGQPRLPAVYCEFCGRGSVGAPAEMLPFRECPECRLLKCSQCWGPPEGILCAPCTDTTITATRPVAGRLARSRLGPIDDRTAVGIAFAALLSALVVVVVIGGLGRPPTGAVLDATARPAGTAAQVARLSPSPATSDQTRPNGSSSTPPSSLAPSPTGASVDDTLVVVDHALVTWKDPFGQVRAEIISQVENRGGQALSIPGGQSGYSISAPDGLIVASGRFGHAFPSIVGPGEHAYLIDSIAATFVDETELADVTVDLHFEPAATGATNLMIDDVRWAIDQNRVLVSGRVTNRGQSPAGPVAVGAVLRDGSDRILCAVYDVGHIGGLAPGESVAFSTSYPEVQPAWPTDAVSVEALAFAKPSR
jgi:hypothetical protein